MAEAEANPAVENPSGDAPVVDPSNPVSSLVAGALAKASAADQTPTEPADPASYRGREGTDFRVANMGGLMGDDRGASTEIDAWFTGEPKRRSSRASAGKCAARRQSTTPLQRTTRCDLTIGRF